MLPISHDSIIFSTTRSLVAHTALQNPYHVVLGHPDYKYLCLDLILKLVWYGRMSVISGIPSQGSFRDGLSMYL